VRGYASERPPTATCSSTSRGVDSGDAAGIRAELEHERCVRRRARRCSRNAASVPLEFRA
jgi:hypothetical protein